MSKNISSTIFDEAREVPLVSIIEHEIGESLVPCGADTYEPESKTCPCGEHQGCFKVKTTGDDGDMPVAKCFSCDKWCNDGAGFLTEFMGAESQYVAAQTVLDKAAEYYESDLPSRENILTALDRPAPVAKPALVVTARSQALFEAAALFFSNQLAKNPVAQKYQLEVRGHDLASLLEHGVGYADGGLAKHLYLKGFTPDEVQRSGLLNDKAGPFFLPGVYVYAHRDRDGRVCHFTQKDPRKKMDWQLPHRCKQGHVQFFGEHTLSRGAMTRRVLLVEGENDWLSCVEAGWTEAILASIGNISTQQLEWIKANLRGWEVITLFDSDDAGDKYRAKLAALQGISAVQYRVPDGSKDPDAWLKQTGKSIQELFTACGTANQLAAALDMDSIPRTDQGSADLLIALADGNLKYVAEHKDFAFFDGNRWFFYQEHAVFQLARRVSQAWHEYAATVVGDDDATIKRRTAISKHALDCQSHARITAMIKLASKDRRLLVSAADFDSHPYLLGVTNGIVDLRTGRLMPADRALLISKQCSVAYHPAAACPQWLSTLHHAQDEGDTAETEAMLTYLQRVLGMALIGKVLERAFFFIYGRPGTSKSVVSTAIRWVMADYALDLSPNSLMQASYQSNDIKMPEIVHLKGVRLALATEAEDGQRYNEGLIKRITGNDEIVARDLNQKAIHFRPQATLIMTGNARPSASGSPAFWERLKVVGFDRQVPVAERNPNLDEELRGEGEGILAWLVRGCLDYQQHRLSEPRKVANASAAYRADLDVMAQFLDDRCIVEADALVSAQGVYADYREWIQNQLGMKPLGRNRFYEQLVEAGFVKDKGRLGMLNSIARFQGLRLVRELYRPI